MQRRSASREPDPVRAQTLEVSSGSAPTPTNTRTCSAKVASHPFSSERLPLKHVLAVILFITLAAVWTFPTVFHLADHLPGEAVGDNVAFLWNLWWMRHAGTAFFFSSYIFAPFGVDLALHTHTALQAAVAATLFRPLGVIPAQNVVIILTLAFNGICAYWLAWDRTRSVCAATTAGIVFGCSPYISAHLLGHFNLISAWPIPLAVLFTLRTLERGSTKSAIALGVCLAAAAFSDYYYLVYCCVLIVGVVFWRSRVLTIVRGAGRPRPVLGRALGIGIVIVLSLITVIVLTGGVDITVATVRIRATEPGNLLTAGWALLGLAIWNAAQPQLRYGGRTGWSAIAADVRYLMPSAIVFILAAFPILRHATTLIANGDYVAPAHQWRSGPAGVDLITLVLGNPSHPISGDWTRAAYARMGLDRIEGVGWLGIVPMAAFAWATMRSKREPTLRPLVVCGWFFFIWSLGPWLKIANVNSGLMLPANTFGLIPLLSNARMPGRAIVGVFLVAAILVARFIAAIPANRRATAAAFACLLVAADYLPAPLPLVTLERPAIYSLIPPGTGSVLELPFGLRDGFGEVGSFDERVLLHQITHNRPVVGGFLARMPPSLESRYLAMPVLGSLLRLSDGAPGPSTEDRARSTANASLALADAGVEYVVVDRNAASTALLAYVPQIGVVPVEHDARYELFRVEDQREPSR